MDSLHEEESPPVDQAAPRARFSADEDQKILRLQQQNLDWNQISQQLGNRSARQCRERFQNYLDPELNTSNWTQEEDDLLILKENEMGKKWKKMMPYFKNRSNVNIKNRFATLQNRKKAADRALHSIDNSSNSHSENNSPATSNPTSPSNSSNNTSAVNPSSPTSPPFSTISIQSNQSNGQFLGQNGQGNSYNGQLNGQFTNQFNSQFNAQMNQPMNYAMGGQMNFMNNQMNSMANSNQFNGQFGQMNPQFNPYSGMSSPNNPPGANTHAFNANNFFGNAMTQQQQMQMQIQMQNMQQQQQQMQQQMQQQLQQQQQMLQQFQKMQASQAASSSSSQPQSQSQSPSPNIAVQSPTDASVSSPPEPDQNATLIEEIFGNDSDFSAKWNFLDTDVAGGNDFNSFFGGSDFF